MVALRSPLPWMGGKHYSADHIIQSFPLPQSYDVYVDLFGGAAHVLLHKSAYKHVEVYNDIDSNLVNFWLQCRDHRQELEERCETLPYSRELYYDYHKSLFADTQLDPLERATRFFYVLRSAYSGWLRSSPCGWEAGSTPQCRRNVVAYHSAIEMFQLVQRRMRHVMIDNRDFSEVFALYDKPRTLFYVDPPYIGAEHYYSSTFAWQDHERLANLLNTTTGYVALSYYPHPQLDVLYPASKWRRVTWDTLKHSQRMKETHDIATEMLLCNYPAAEVSLWG